MSPDYLILIIIATDLDHLIVAFTLIALLKNNNNESIRTSERYHDSQYLIGMISKNDIERISFVTGAQTTKANTEIYESLLLEQVMTTKLDTVEAKDEIRNAARLLANGDYHALPVLQDGRLEGIVTSTDVINYLLEQY